MAGVRIAHATQRNVRMTIVETDRPYQNGPQQCTPPEFGGCGSVHLFKTHHLNLDETGTTIIGDVLYEKIKLQLLTNGFRELNVVKKPPTLGIGVGMQTPGSGDWGNIPIVRGEGDSHG